ncbi:hypothetical protein EAG_02035 [Camponotus floridanus]|uniref:Uncharacterized protein n=1 Tax=Camponotus floridanus TaxID=104421 RepID=E2A0A6_CAMFO|nr:hypothetical protein EAG_02035 [Camponotus floridanus]
MGLHVFWPASACLTLFVVCVIIVLLKYGTRVCKLRHEPLPSDQEWEDDLVFCEPPKWRLLLVKELYGVLYTR